MCRFLSSHKNPLQRTMILFQQDMRVGALLQPRHVCLCDCVKWWTQTNPLKQSVCQWLEHIPQSLKTIYLPSDICFIPMGRKDNHKIIEQSPKKNKSVFVVPLSLEWVCGWPFKFTSFVTKEVSSCKSQHDVYIISYWAQLKWCHSNTKRATLR